MEQVRAWHTQSADSIFDQLKASASGLSAEEVAIRQQRFGSNRLPEPRRVGRIRRFFRQFHNVFIYILLVAGVITLMLGHLSDTAVIWAVVLLNAVIGYLQEGKAVKAIAAIRHMLAPRASVMRDGRRHTVPGDQLVPGDIVLLDAGDRVPADLRLFRSHSLQVQESVITGESVAVEKQVEPLPLETPLAEQCCIAFSGTTVVSGQGSGIVVAIGSNTEVGRISGLLETVETLTTPLVEQMAVLARWLTLVIVLVALGLLGYGYLVQHHAFDELFLAVVGLSVAAIPEGLPAVLTITLAVGVQAMAGRHAIVRRLPSIEAIGAVSVICTDKTGTLTRNEMSVASLVLADHTFTVDGSGYAPFGVIRELGEPVDGEQLPPAIFELARCAVLCNDSELRKQHDAFKVEGDPMEGALLTFSSKVGSVPSELRLKWHRTDVIPFDTANRFMATLNHDHEGHGVICLKGAPETILALCSGQLGGDGQVTILDSGFWHGQFERIAGEGQRVLAFASLAVEGDKTVLELEDVQQGLAFIGVVGLIDPPREEAVTAVAECVQAGISVKMITGDHVTTAMAIGRQLGLPDADQAMTGIELDRLGDAELATVVRRVTVFARTSPEHKLRLVEALQALNMTVAMTGDGVNDAPALRRADVGIAMGGKGTEAAKEVSDLVLADDNFASIVSAVGEGRTVRDNIRKEISWTLPTSSGEACTIILALLLGISLPVTPVQILWINMITTVTLGMALAFEPAEPGSMRRKPRPRHDPLLSGALLWHIVLVSVLFLIGVFSVYYHAISQGYPVALARTLAMNTLVAMEVFHLFFIRNMNGTSLNWRMMRGTPVIWLAVVGVTIGQLAITYLPWAQKVFGTNAMSLQDGLLVVAVGIGLFVIVELEKQVRLRSGGWTQGG